MSTKQEALAEIAAIARGHGLTAGEIAAALKDSPEQRAQKSTGILTRVFYYIGGILVFAGFCLGAGMVWDDLNAAARIVLTLGAGFCAFVFGVVTARDGRYDRAVTPLFIVAALLEPAGILISLDEFSRGGDPAHGMLFMTFVMAVQQGLVFIALRRTVLAFMTSFFAAGMFAIAFDLMGMDETLVGLVMGLSIMCVAWALGRSPHRVIAPIHYFGGSVLFLVALFDVVEGSPLEVLYLGVTCGLVYLSAVARSRTLLTVGTLSTLGYIGYFTAEHFENTLGWPVLLVLLGFIMIGLGSLAVRINKKYIQQAS